MTEERIEWEVAWFPPELPDQFKIYQSEYKARERFRIAAESGHFPILSRRTIVITEWGIVESAND